jgi:hypothetical protein
MLPESRIYSINFKVCKEFLSVQDFFHVCVLFNYELHNCDWPIEVLQKRSTIWALMTLVVKVADYIS